MKPGYLLDTNHLGEAVRKVSRLRERIHRVARSGTKIGTCIHVLCELETGFCQLTHPDPQRRILRRLLGETVRLWPVELSVARIFGEIHLLLRQRGRHLSYVDIVLAALAKDMNLTLLTTDRDFEALPDLRTENWLS